MEYLGKIVDKKDLTTTEQVENYVAEFGGQIDTITVDNVLIPVDQNRNAAITLDYKANVAYVNEELAKKANSSALATVSFSGSYNDLSDQPDDKFALITDTGNKIDLEIDSETYQLVAKLYNKNNNLISTSNIIDLPIEELVINVSFKSETRELIITLKNGTKVEIPLVSIIDGLATQQWVEAKGYAVDNTLAAVAKSGSYNDLEDVPEIPDIPTKVSAFENDIGYVTNSIVNGYATEEWVESKNYLTQHQDISGKADELYVDTELAKKADKITLADVATSGSYTDLSDVPTNVSAFTNDKGYLTQHQSLEDYATEAWVEAKNYLTEHQDISGKADVDYVDEELSKKADKTEIPSLDETYKILELSDGQYLTDEQYEDVLNGFIVLINNNKRYFKFEEKTNYIEYQGFSFIQSDLEQRIYKYILYKAFIQKDNKRVFFHDSYLPLVGDTYDSAYPYGMSGIAVAQAVSTKQDKITSTNKLSYDLLKDVPTIPTVPTNVSAFTNDAGYLTSHQDISSKQDIIDDLADIRTGAGLGSTAVQPLTLTQALSAYRTAEAQDIIDANIPSSAKDLILGENISVQVAIGGYKVGDVIDANTSVFDVLSKIFSASN